MADRILTMVAHKKTEVTHMDTKVSSQIGTRIFRKETVIFSR